jgi:exosortase/archaeosortase family protein
MNSSKYFSREDMNDRQEKLFEGLKFFSKLLFAGLIFQAILYIYPDTTSLQAFLAQITAVLVDPLMKTSFTASGINVVTEGFRYVITQDCLGWKSMAAFTALIFASTEKYRKNLKYVLGGILVIFLANIARIVTTIYLSHTGIISFEIIHDTLWKWSLTGLVLVLWVIWFEKLRHIDEPLSELKAFVEKFF